jgi:hypothetical protein
MNNIVKVFCGVKYENKNIAKEKGAKWDTEKKSWYFQYPLDEFEENENKHTYQFKPYAVLFVNCPEYDSKDTKAQNEFSNTFFEIANNRTLKYINIQPTI